MRAHLNRRQFLHRSLVTGAALGLTPGGRAAGGETSANNKIALGCVGVGSMGVSNMKNFLDLEEVRVVAVCDAYADRRENAKSIVDAKYGDAGCAMYGDYRELLAREDIDAVMIAAQDHWHALMATEAARAGKDLYCEKPLGVSVQESRIIRDTVRETKRVFQTGTWQRSLADFQHACTLARNGYLGSITRVEVAAEGPRYRPKYAGSLDPQPVPEGFDWAMWRGPAPDEPYNPGRVAWPDWYLIWDYCAGFICNWGVHHLDIANWGCARVGTTPFAVACQATYRNEGFTNNVDSWDATFTYDDGLIMRFTDETGQKLGCRFIGDEGWVHVDRAGIWAEPGSLLTVQFKDTDERLTDSTHHGRNLADCIRTRTDPVSNVDAAHVASYQGMLADIAARLGQSLHWDPKAERFTGNDEANAMLERPMHNGWSL